MKKQRKQLIILLVVALLLLLGIKGAEYLTEKENEDALNTEMVIVLDLEAEHLTELSYSYEGEEYSFLKKDDTWYAAEDESLAITQYMITAMETKIAPLTATEQIDNVEDLSQYGLAEPARYVKCVADGVTYDIQIGDYNELTGEYYICFNGENTVYTVAEAFVLAFNKTMEDVVEVVEESSEESAEETTTGDSEEEGADSSEEDSESGSEESGEESVE